MAQIKQDTRKKILRFLIENKQESFTGYQITKMIYAIPESETGKIVSKRPFVQKILNKESQKGIIKKKNSKPCFYSINHKFLEINTDKNVWQVECPRCHREWWVEKDQDRKTCKCLSDGKKEFRFWINKNRLKQFKTTK